MRYYDSQHCQASHCGAPRRQSNGPHLDLIERFNRCGHLGRCEHLRRCGHYLDEAITALRDRGLGTYLILLLGTILALVLIRLVR